MAFSDDAVGFFLQLDDQLSPKLDVAVGNYESYVKQIDKLNQQAYTKQNAMLGGVAQLLDDFKNLPAAAEKAYSKTMALLRKKAKSLRQPVEIALSIKSEQAIGRTVAEAMTKVMRGATLRMTAVPPLRKSPFWDTSQPLRPRYREMPQPPDLRGRFQNLPKFAEGGEVLGSKKDMDSVLAWLTPGEIVLPVDVAANLKSVTGRKNLPKDLAASIANVQNLAAALPSLKQASDLGLDPKAADDYAKGMSLIEQNMNAVTAAASKMSMESKKKVLPTLAEVHAKYKASVVQLEDMAKVAGKDVPKGAAKTADALDDVADEAESAGGGIKKIFKDIFGTTRFIALNRALRDTGNLLSKVFANASETFSRGEGEKVDDFVTSFNMMNQSLGMTRSELREFKGDMFNRVTDLGDVGNLTSFANAADALVQAGVRVASDGGKRLLDTSADVALMTEASTANADTLARMSYKLGDSYEFNRDRIGGVFANIHVVSTRAAVDAQTLADETLESIDNMGMAYASLAKRDQAAASGMLTNLSLMHGAIADNWGGAKEIIELTTKAIGGDVESMTRAMAVTGMSAEQLQQAFVDGDPTTILTNIAAQINSIADAPGLSDVDKSFQLRNLKDALGVADMTDAAFMKLGTSTDAITDKFRVMQADVVDAAGATDYLRESAEANTTTWQRWANTFNKWAGKAGMLDAMDFIKEFNPSLLLSTVYLGNNLLMMGGRAIGTLGKLTGVGGAAGEMFGNLTRKVMSFIPGLRNVSKAAEAHAAVTKVQTTQMATQAKVGKGLGGMLADLGKGIGGLLKGIGRGAGGAIAGLFQGMAAGLRALANPYVLAGVGVAALIGVTVAGTAYGLAHAAKVADPAIQTLVGGVTAIFDTLSLMEPSQILATSAAMLAVGPSLSAIGVGAALMGQGLLVAAPGMVVFAGALWLLNRGGGKGGGVGAAITSLADTFTFEPGVVDRVVEGMAAVRAVTARLAVTTPMVAAAVPLLIAFSTADVALGAVPVHGQGVVSFVDAASNSFGQIDQRKAKDAVEGMDTAASLMVRMTALDALSMVQRVAGRVGQVQDMTDAVLGWFGVRSPMQRMADQGREIASTVVSLQASFAPLARDKAKLAASADAVSVVGQFIDGYAKAYRGMRGSAPGIGEAMADWVRGWFYGGRSPMQSLDGVADDMINTAQSIAGKFQRMDATTMRAVTVAAGPIKSVAEMVGGFADAYGSLRDATPGALDAVADFFGWAFSGGDSAMDRLLGASDDIVRIGNALPLALAPLAKLNPDNIERAKVGVGYVSDLMGGILPAMEALEKAGATADDLADGWVFSGGLTKVTKLMPDLVQSARDMQVAMAPLVAIPQEGRAVTLAAVAAQAEMTTKVAESVASAAALSVAVAEHGPAIRRAARVRGAVMVEVAAIVTDVKAFTESIEVPVQVGLKPQITSVAVENTPEVSADALVAEVKKPMLTETEINRLITLQVEAKATDEAVRDELRLVKDVLMQQLELMRRQVPPTERRPATPGAPVSSDLRRVAGGFD